MSILHHAVVVTPNPRQHALLASKRNIALLSRLEVLGALGSGPINFV
jgi:hypothetical protein